MDDANKIMVSLEKPCLFIDGTTETVKNETKKKIKKLDFFKAAIAPTAASLMALCFLH